MTRRIRSIVLGISLGIVVGPYAVTACYAAQSKSLPEFSALKQVVVRYFDKLPDYRPGDLITQSQIKPVLLLLRRAGWTPTDTEDLLEQVPADGEFLARELATIKGRKFMRQISGYPDAYDRLERLARMPHGKQTVREMIRKPGGYELIEYMTTTSGGKNLGKKLSKARKGRNFNKPTGRIYTVKMLLAELEDRYRAARQSKPKKGK